MAMLLSSLPKCTHHLRVLGIGPALQWDVLDEALLLRFMGVKGNPSGKWEKTDVFKDEDKYF